MHHSAYINAEKFYHKYCENNIENKKILDVGSYDVNGTMKPIFKKGQYIGLDMEQGPNVDIVGVSHDIPFPNNDFDVVISSSCFEHDDMFWISFQEMCRVLKPEGYMYIQAPSNGPYHGWPGDNWRFYIDSWKALEKWGKRLGYEIELIEHYIDTTTPPHEREGSRVWNDSIGIFRKRPIFKNKVALISTFCDTQEKLNVLEKNIKIVKSHNIDVIVISPFTLPEKINKLCDYMFITKDNPVLEWPVKAMCAWKKFDVNGVIHEITRIYPDYGFAGLTQIKQLSNIALSMDYDQFYHMIYDVKIDDNIIEGFNSNRTCNVYPSKRGDTKWEVGLHYMIFDRDNLKKFVSYITLENYISFIDGEAFAWLYSIKDKIGYNIEKIPVEDEIYYYENQDLFNLSPIDGFKFFIGKQDKKLENVKLYFYGNEGEREIEINVEGNKTKQIVKNHDIIDLGFNELNYKSVIITYNSTDYDITDIIVKIKNNILKIG